MVCGSRVAIAMMATAGAFLPVSFAVSRMLAMFELKMNLYPTPLGMPGSIEHTACLQTVALAWF